MKALLPRRVPTRAPAFQSSKSPFICTSCLSSCRQFATTSARRAAASPPSPPATGYTTLLSRHLISVAGIDAPKFLQGLIAASIYHPSTPKSPEKARREGFYTGFLTATGRVMHDVFIYPDLEHFGVEEADKKGLLPGQAFLIEVGQNQVDALMELIRRYRLRSIFKHRKLDKEECTVWACWDDGNNYDSIPAALLRDGAYVARDNRAPDMGYRVVMANNKSLKIDADRCNSTDYKIRRYLRGIPEGSGEIFSQQMLPLDANMDLMGGIDFRKGCYVGQELTIRTKHRGVVRKRILPCMIYGEEQGAPQELLYRPDPEGVLAATDVPMNATIGRDGKSGRNAGKWIQGVGNIGLAMCRLQIMTDIDLPGETAASAFDPNNEFVMEWGADGHGLGGTRVKVKAFVPDWMRQKLGEDTTNGRSVE
ncbi:hypothetical protein BJ170DRAFT_626390 [Xylariales sp. AK1849]|nr:hypothetical protein BJ170DRAFT_626390 [Xylariales sp. AK1849]